MRAESCLGVLFLILGIVACSDDSTNPIVAPETPPIAPTELIISDIAPTRVSLGWRDRSTDEIGFEIERRVAGTAEFVRVDTSAANAASFVDRTVAEGTTYDYRVIAYRDALVSQASNVATATAIQNGAPSTPSDEFPPDGASDIAPDSSFALTWESEDPDGDALTYDVYFGTSFASLTAIATGQTQTEVPLPTALEANKSYFWRVVVKDSKGVSRFARNWSFSTVVDRVSVPFGYSIMGDTQDFVHPGNPIISSAFDIDRYEVTNQQYANYLNRALDLDLIVLSAGTVYDPTGRLPYLDLRLETVNGVDRGDIDSAIYFSRSDSAFIVTDGREDFPVIQVSWYGAIAFADFFRRRLPTEAEWEKAARGTDTELGTRTFFRVDTLVVGIGYPYPWGADPDTRRGNFRASGDPFENVSRVRTTPVGFYDGTVRSGYQTADGASFYGVQDMAGNVWEWCDDWYGPYRNPHDPPAVGQFKVVRGASYNQGIGSAITWNRSHLEPATRDRIVGFRTARLR